MRGKLTRQVTIISNIFVGKYISIVSHKVTRNQIYVHDMIRGFMSSMGTIDTLVMGDYDIGRKDGDVRRLLGEKSEKGVMLPPTYPRRSRLVNYKSNSPLDKDDTVKTVTCVCMPDRPMHD